MKRFFLVLAAGIITISPYLWLSSTVTALEPKPTSKSKGSEQPVPRAPVTWICDGSDVGNNVCSQTAPGGSLQFIDSCANDGDTVQMPGSAGSPSTTSWFTGVQLTHSLTVIGATTIAGAGGPSATPTDATIIIDEVPTPAPGSGVAVPGLFKATIPTGKTFLLQGITFRQGNRVGQNQDGAIRFTSNGLVQNARITQCHFDNLRWQADVGLLNWVLGVGDHNLFECPAPTASPATKTAHMALMQDQIWGGGAQGNGSWADYPCFGGYPFWFWEDNSIYSRTSTDQTSGSIDANQGGRYVARHNYWINGQPSGHGTEGGNARGQRCDEVYFNTMQWTYAHSFRDHRGGSTIWHDNYFTPDANFPNQTTVLVLSTYRMLGGVAAYLTGSGTNKCYWGTADGSIAWDNFDTRYGPSPSPGAFAGIAITPAPTPTPTGTPAPPPTQLIGQSTGVLTIAQPGPTMSPNQFAPTSSMNGWVIVNDQPGAAPSGKSSGIISNTDQQITYYAYTSGDRGPTLVWNAGEHFTVRRIINALDQNGRGKDTTPVINAATPGPFFTAQQPEPCLSWNNVGDGPAVPGSRRIYGIIATQASIERANEDFVNLGDLGPTPSPYAVPSAATRLYPASINGPAPVCGAYTTEYTYPHPLQSGILAPTPTPTAGAGTPTPACTVAA